MAENTQTATSPDKKGSKGDDWVKRHKTALIAGGIAIALVIVFIVLRNRGGTTATPTGYTASLANTNPLLNTSGDLSNLVGPAGPAGPAGPPGKRGPRGPRGKKGKPPTRKPHPKRTAAQIQAENLTHAHNSSRKTH